MSDDAAVRDAMQKQALRLRDEFHNVDEIRSVVKPVYDQDMQCAKMRFTVSDGTCDVWWDENHWKIALPGGVVTYVAPGTLRQSLRQGTQRLRNDALVVRLRQEFANLEEIRTVVQPAFDQHIQRAVLRFTLPNGMCLAWWQDDRWAMQFPSNAVGYVPAGKLREALRRGAQARPETQPHPSKAPQQPQPEPPVPVPLPESPPAPTQTPAQPIPTLDATFIAHLRNEFDDLEEVRDLAQPVYDQDMQRTILRFSVAGGTCDVWWEYEQWQIRVAEGLLAYAMPGKLRETLRLGWERLEEEAIMGAMEYQMARLRQEFSEMEELLGWARPYFDRESKQPEVRFDTPGGLCRFWWGNTNRWHIQLPDGSFTYARASELNEMLSQVRKLLRTGG